MSKSSGWRRYGIRRIKLEYLIKKGKLGATWLASRQTLQGNYKGIKDMIKSAFLMILTAIIVGGLMNLIL